MPEEDKKTDEAEVVKDDEYWRVYRALLKYNDPIVAQRLAREQTRNRKGPRMKSEHR